MTLSYAISDIYKIIKNNGVINLMDSAISITPQETLHDGYIVVIKVNEQYVKNLSKLSCFNWQINLRKKCAQYAAQSNITEYHTYNTNNEQIEILTNAINEALRSILS
jgi:hypothetical protein